MSYIYSTIKTKVQEEARMFECISSRYELPYCLMLVYCDARDDIAKIIRSNMRCADRVVEIDEYYSAVLFFMNRPDSFVVVGNKILYVLEKMYPQTKIAIGVACKERLDSEDIVAKALQNVLDAKNQSTNTIVDHF
ncbi:hypothetical protein [Nitratiruptor tergarcus]|nr:hypothetical protein [Nitratiruptor tergarcus]